MASEILKIWVEVELTGRDKEEKEEDTGGKDTKRQEAEEANATEKESTNQESKSASPTTSTKEYNLVAKFNSGSEFDQEYVKTMNLDLNELLIYSDVIPHLNAWQEQVLKEKGEEGEALDRYKVLVPEYVYGVCTYNQYVLVMQDVSVLG